MTTEPKISHQAIAQAVEVIRAVCLREARRLCEGAGLVMQNMLAEMLADRTASALQEERDV